MIRGAGDLLAGHVVDIEFDDDDGIGFGCIHAFEHERPHDVRNAWQLARPCTASGCEQASRLAPRPACGRRQRDDEELPHRSASRARPRCRRLATGSPREAGSWPARAPAADRARCARAAAERRRRCAPVRAVERSRDASRRHEIEQRIPIRKLVKMHVVDGNAVYVRLGVRKERKERERVRAGGRGKRGIAQFVGAATGTPCPHAGATARRAPQGRTVARAILHSSR